MCHIGTWSTRYCMRTAEKVWRSKVKKKIRVCRVSKNDTRERSLFAECHMFAEFFISGTRQIASLPSSFSVELGKEPFCRVPL